MKVAKKTDKPKLFLNLTGGLGNQLFILAAGLAQSDRYQIVVTSNLGSPRTNKLGIPEICSFDLKPFQVEIEAKKKGLLTRKTTGYLLRSGIWPKKMEKLKVFSKILNLLSTFVFFGSFKVFVHPIVASQVGFETLPFKEKPKRKSPALLIGYFQSYKWAEKVKSAIESFDLLEKGNDLIQLEMEAAAKSPIVIHVRRGDYREQITFGLADANYYRKALDLVLAKYAEHPIWVFSDEIEEAKNLLPAQISKSARFISDVDGEVSASLCAMRLGCAYIIANSSFSWWGAYMSVNPSPYVVAPLPWFSGQPEPKDLIPPNWTRIRYLSTAP